MRKNLISILILCLAIVACDKDEETPRNDSSIIPDTFQGRDNVDLGTMYVNSRSLTISVWDHGAIDGDIVSIYVNGEKVIDYQELDGPTGAYSVDIELKYNGYNYILLYAHNEGDLPPNTCTMALFDDVDYSDYILEANLTTNGCVNVVVE